MYGINLKDNANFTQCRQQVRLMIAKATKIGYIVFPVKHAKKEICPSVILLGLRAHH